MVPRRSIVIARAADFLGRDSNRRDVKNQRWRAKIGEIEMAHELLLDKCHRLAGLVALGRLCEQHSHQTQAAVRAGWGRRAAA